MTAATYCDDTLVVPLVVLRDVISLGIQELAFTLPYDTLWLELWSTDANNTSLFSPLSVSDCCHKVAIEQFCVEVGRSVFLYGLVMKVPMASHNEKMRDTTQPVTAP